MLVIATDVDGVYTGWGTPDTARLSRVTPNDLDTLEFAAGSMGPKVEAACGFVRTTGKPAAIAALTGVAGIVAGEHGHVGRTAHWVNSTVPPATSVFVSPRHSTTTGLASPGSALSVELRPFTLSRSRCPR